MKKLIAALIGGGALVVASALPAFAHDVTPVTPDTPDNGSQCTSPTTGEVKFNATNMGSEVRDLFVYLNGTLVGQTLDFTGNGSHKVDITVPAGLSGDVTFTWSTDAVAHPPANIVINWDKPKCQPEVTTTTTSTTVACSEGQTRDDEGECQVTTTSSSTTIPQETTTTTSTTVPQDTTTTSTTVPCDVTHTCNFPTTTVPDVTTTVPPSSTVADSSTTTVASKAAPVPEPETPTVTPSVPAELPHTGSGDGPLVLGTILVGAGVGTLVLSKVKRKPTQA